MRARESLHDASDHRLLELLVGKRAAAQVEHRPLHQLLDSTRRELADLGLRRSGRERLVAVAEIARRHQPALKPATPITTPKAAVSHLAALRREPSEVLCALLLDSRMCLMDLVRVAEGGIARVAVTPREVFAPAVARRAAGLVLAHNHPSGNPEPSAEDVDFTRSMRDAGELLDIQVLDHLVVARRGYCSLREAGLI